MLHTPKNESPMSASGGAPAPPAAAAAEPLLRVVDLHKRFGAQEVLRGLSIDFPAGRTTAVLGPSGCGKSVMLKHAAGLMRPDRGEVWFEGERMDRLNERRLRTRRLRMGFVFQHAALFDSMDVEANVRFPLDEHGDLPASRRRARALEMLDLVGMAEHARKMPAELSGGQRKRVAIARAVVLEPRIILYDEPTTGLDPIRADVINELMNALRRELGCAGILVTHDMPSAFKCADGMVMLHEGRVLFAGTPEDTRRSDNPVVQRFLAGEASPEELAAIRRTGHGGGSRGGARSAPDIEVVDAASAALDRARASAPRR